MNQKEDYIAVFDSGVGGLSVLRELRRELPGERFLYFGDSANAPYGVRPVDEVRQLTLAAAEKLMRRGIKALVVACNTATAAAITTLRETYPNLIVIGIEPALKLATDRFPGGTIGVMATPVTLHQEKYDLLLHRVGHDCRILEIPAPLLVPLVEQGRGCSAEAEDYLRTILPKEPLDALVLGCTHFPFAAPVLKKILGDRVALVDGGAGTARETRRRLTAAGLLGEGPGGLEMENSLGTPEILERSWQLLQANLDR